MSRAAGLAYTRLPGPPERAPLVVLPGLFGGRPGAALRRLAAARPVVCVDALGCGESDAPTDPQCYEWPAQVRRLLDLLDALGLESVDLAGWSLGGVWAQHLLRIAPDRVRAAVLAATTPALRARERALIEHQRCLCDSDLPGEALLRGLVPLLLSPDFLHRPGAQALFEAHLAATPGSRDGLRAQLRALLSHTSGPAQPQVRRVLAGAHDWLFPPREVSRLAAELGAPIEVFPDSGHALWIEQPDRLVSATLAALDA